LRFPGVAAVSNVANTAALAVFSYSGNQLTKLRRTIANRLLVALAVAIMLGPTRTKSQQTPAVTAGPANPASAAGAGNLEKVTVTVTLGSNTVPDLPVCHRHSEWWAG
jgi:hypothetical protein